MAKVNKRLDRDGAHRQVFESNKAKIFSTQSVCGICGRPVDFGIKFPHPMSACIDHIVPLNKGGHPSDISNMQLAHMSCNRAKSDKLFRAALEGMSQGPAGAVNNRDLPQSCDWTQYRSRQDGGISPAAAP